jgi:hypothetical protein
MSAPGVQLVDSAGNSLSLAGNVLTVTVAAGSGTAATQSTTNTVIAAGTASNTTIKTGAGRLFGVTVTAVGTVAPMVFTDGGVTIFALAIAAPVGFYPANIPFVTNLVAVGLATNPAVTVSYA